MNRGSRANGSRTTPTDRSRVPASPGRARATGWRPAASRPGRDEMTSWPRPSPDGTDGTTLSRVAVGSTRAKHAPGRREPEADDHGNRETRPDDSSWIEFLRGGTGFLEIGDDFHRFPRPRVARTSLRRHEAAGSLGKVGSSREDRQKQIVPKVLQSPNSIVFIRARNQM